MPATSEPMRKLFCIAQSIKEGETKADYSAEAAKLAEENSLETLRHYCESPVEE